MADNPSVKLPGTVEKIIKPPGPDMPEKAQITVEGADHLYKEIRVDNKLIDQDGNEVKLKEGAKVEVTLAATPEATTPKNEEQPTAPQGPEKKSPPAEK